MSNLRWVCAQIGAREHYAVPRALHSRDRLAMFCTDFWAGAMTRLIAAGPLRSLRTRFHPSLASGSAAVCSWNMRALEWERLLRGKYSGDQADSSGQNRYGGFVEVGRRFARCVRDELMHEKTLCANTIFFAYDTGALEAFEWCQTNGVKCILNQMDPNRVEVENVQVEEKNWPGWVAQPLSVPEEYFVRREREWLLADRIVVNSEFSRKALIKQGVPVEKLFVIPLCYETDGAGRETKPKQREANQPLRVLFLGQVILRKGIQYLIAAAREMERENIQFDIVGPLGISHKAIKAAPANVTFHGRVSRDQAAAWYKRSHVFALPTVSDGFAITQIEAMTYGLPVVATPNCGEVVADGVDGFIAPARDSGALVRIFQRYLAQPELLPVHSVAALHKSQKFSLESLANNLIRLEATLK